MGKSQAVKARDYGEQRIEALGQTPYVDFEADDGTIVRLPHPLRLDDAALTRYERFQRGDGLDREAVLDESGEPKTDPDTGKLVTRIVTPHQIKGEPAEPVSVRLIRAVLGEKAHKTLLDSGMTSAELARAWEEMAETADNQ